jgi:hypothetical protein
VHRSDDYVERMGPYICEKSRYKIIYGLQYPFQLKARGHTVTKMVTNGALLPSFDFSVARLVGRRFGYREYMV